MSTTYDSSARLPAAANRQHQRQPERQHQDGQRHRPAIQLRASERIIDEWLAALKSDHIPDAPVRLTVTAPLPSACSGFFKSSEARTISLVSAFAPPRTIVVRPSAETVTPGRGGITIATRGSVRRRASTLLMTC